ncbi:DUF3040 domain-containing protein [Paenarthrobacter sp. NPDC092416]|uniref:DUF3040 domain-containing protein n=1 Tax=Paenarthrobacter sp. NPDC092416 TaxID=3364386 RepID=UPI0038102EA9
MALSEEERRRLEQLEHELAIADPDLDLELKLGKPRGMGVRTVLSVLAAVAGFAMIITGIMSQVIILGVIGFLLMSAGATWFLSGLWARRGFK